MDFEGANIMGRGLWQSRTGVAGRHELGVVRVGVKAG